MSFIYKVSSWFNKTRSKVQEEVNHHSAIHSTLLYVYLKPATSPFDDYRRSPMYSDFHAMQDRTLVAESTRVAANLGR
jgi:hypothetical protein